MVYTGCRESGENRNRLHSMSAATSLCKQRDGKGKDEEE